MRLQPRQTRSTTAQFRRNVSCTCILSLKWRKRERIAGLQQTGTAFCGGGNAPLVPKQWVAGLNPVSRSKSLQAWPGGLFSGHLKAIAA